MAPASPMTWNWKWKLTATGATALAGWLASPPMQPAAPAARAANAPAAVPSKIAQVTEIAEQTRRLDARIVSAPVPPPSRNLFQFAARPVVRRAPVAPPVTAAPAPAAPAPFPLRLTGIAVDIVNGAERRTAVVSGPGGIELAAAGEPAAPGYKVIDVGESFADIERTSDGVRERLTLRP